MVKIQITKFGLKLEGGANETVVGAKDGNAFIAAGQAGNPLCGFFQTKGGSLVAFSTEPDAPDGGELVVVANPAVKNP